MASETPIRAPYLDVAVPTFSVRLGACRLRITRAAPDAAAWIEGTYRDPGGEDPVKLHVEDGRVTLSQDRPLDRAVGLLHGVPSCSLALGTAAPFRLEVETGASDVDLELGGIPLRSLAVRAGAGRVEIDVDTANPADADEVTLQVGAGGLDARRLGNLAASRMRVDSGAAGVVLDLTGELRRHLDVRVSAGMSGLRLRLPEDRPARLHATTTLGSQDIGDGFVTRDGAVSTLVDGEPVVEVTATVALGNLLVRAGR